MIVRIVPPTTFIAAFQPFASLCFKFIFSSEYCDFSSFHGNRSSVLYSALIDFLDFAYVIRHTGEAFCLPIDMNISKPDSSLNKRKWAQNIMRKKRISTSK